VKAVTFHWLAIGKVIAARKSAGSITLGIEGNYQTLVPAHSTGAADQKTRYFGGWSNNRLWAYMSRCEELLSKQRGIRCGVKTLNEAEEKDFHYLAEHPLAEKPAITCVHLREHFLLTLLSETPKTKWRANSCGVRVQRAIWSAAFRRRIITVLGRSIW